MSGRTAFSYRRWLALCEYVWQQMGVQHRSTEGLAWHMFKIDFEAYRLTGHSITGATYLRGAQYPEVREVGIGWFRRFVRAKRPWWARACGWLAVGYAAWRALA